jgi:glycosyltransferase involved in cell wall biosynthesis
MTKVRVGVIATVDLSVRHVLLNQLLALERAGFDVTVVSADGPDIPAVTSRGIRHLTVNFTRRMAPLQDLSATFALWRLFRRERFTIVHTHFPKPGIFGQIAAKLARVPIIVNTLHGFFFHDNSPPKVRRMWITLEKIAARCSSAILSQNAEDVKTAVAEGICRPDQIERLGNGIDLVRFDPASIPPARTAVLRQEFGIPDDAEVVGFVGRLVLEKGIAELFEAIGELRRTRPRLRLLIVGPRDPDKADALDATLTERFGISDITVFTGFRDDTQAMYTLMNVFVLPSHREGFPRTAMEASAMGVPLVVTDIRGCREAVVAERNGLFVPPKTSAPIAQAVGRILDDSALAARLSAGGRALARERFDEQQVFEKVRQTYLRLLSAKGLAPS